MPMGRDCSRRQLDTGEFSSWWAFGFSNGGGFKSRIQLQRILELTSLFDTPVADALFYSILVFCCGI